MNQHILVFVLLSSILTASHAQRSLAADFYVATNGSDTNPGTNAAPFRTLEAARDAIRSLKKKSSPLDGGVTVWLRGGDYVRTGALELTDVDSGSKEQPIVWRAVEGERVRLLGGRKLAGFKTVTDADVLKRLPSAARGQVWQCDLRALGVTEFGEMQSRGFGRTTTPAHCELFFAGRPMTLARWPNEGSWEKIADFPQDSAIGDGHGGKTGKLVDGFNYKGERPRGWKGVDDIWIHGYWSWDWANSYERIASIDLDRHLLKTAPPHGTYGFRKGQRFYFLNVLEELDQPGEWFLDRKHAIVYFWPPKPIASGESLLSLSEEPLLRLKDVSHLSFRGLTLEATRGNAVEMQGGSRNRLAGCTIRNIGDWGIKIAGGNDHGVIGCDIFDTGDGGIDMTGGDRETLTPGGHFVQNCHFQRQGRWSKCYVPAVHMQGVGQRVAHCLIHDHPHCAILFSGNDHSIEFNEIHHIAMETGDVGAIYAGRNYTFRGNRIRHNYIHHTHTAGSGGSMGVYMDDCMSGTEIYGNVFYKVHWAVFLGGGRDHHVENNIFVDCDPTLRMDGRGLDASTTWRNNVIGLGKSLAEMPSALYRQRYPALKSLDAYFGKTGAPLNVGDDFKGVPPEHNVVKRNICVGGKWLHVSWHAEPDELDLADNLVGEEPGFVSEEKNGIKDFRLKKDSPAFKKGFRAIPLEKIGLQLDEYRRELPERNQTRNANNPSAAAGQAASDRATQLSPDAIVANDKKPVGSILAEHGDLSVLFRDNSESPKVLSGLQSLFNLKDADGYDAYDPSATGSSAGLNFEHIISGHNEERNKFTPRHGKYTLHRIDERTVELRRRREDSPWDVSSSLRYSVVAPHYVDFEFKCIPHDRTKFGKRGYGIFFWANYMNQVDDVALHFLGKANAEGDEKWIAGSAPNTHRDHIGGGTYRHVSAPPLEYDSDHNFKLNVWSYDWPRFTKPFYFGRAANDMSLMLMFDRTYSKSDEIRFSLFKFKVQDERRKPAWDFQYVIHDVEVGREYGYRGRLVWKKFVSDDDCLREYESWQRELRR